MYPSRTLSGKSNDPTVIAAPGCPAARAWPGEPWLPEFVHAPHSTARARQAAWRTFRRRGIRLIALATKGEPALADTPPVISASHLKSHPLNAPHFIMLPPSMGTHQ